MDISRKRQRAPFPGPDRRDRGGPSAGQNHSNLACVRFSRNFRPQTRSSPGTITRPRQNRTFPQDRQASGRADAASPRLTVESAADSPPSAPRKPAVAPARAPARRRNCIHLATSGSGMGGSGRTGAQELILINSWAPFLAFSPLRGRRRRGPSPGRPGGASARARPPAFPVGRAPQERPESPASPAPATRVATDRIFHRPTAAAPDAGDVAESL